MLITRGENKYWNDHMGFFQTVRDSIYNPSFYASARTEKVSASVRYFFLFMLAVSLVTGISFSLSMWHWLSSTDAVRTTRNAVLASYPDELVLDFKDGHLSTNVPEPYFIPTPTSLRGGPSESADKKMPANIIVIDTTHTITPSDFVKYDTGAILSGDSLWISDIKNNKVDVRAYASMKKDAFTVDKKQVTVWADMIIGYLKPFFTVLLLTMPLLILGVFSAGYLLYLILGAALIWIIARIRKVDLTYGESYQLGLHLLTGPILYGLLATFIPALNIPFLFTLILIVLAALNLVPQSPEIIPLPEPAPVAIPETPIILPESTTAPEPTLPDPVIVTNIATPSDQPAKAKEGSDGIRE